MNLIQGWPTLQESTVKISTPPEVQLLINKEWCSGTCVFQNRLRVVVI